MEKELKYFITELFTKAFGKVENSPKVNESIEMGSCRRATLKMID